MPARRALPLHRRLRAIRFQQFALWPRTAFRLRQETTADWRKAGHQQPENSALLRWCTGFSRSSRPCGGHNANCYLKLNTAAAIREYVNFLAVEREVAASTQNQALNAIWTAAGVTQ